MTRPRKAPAAASPGPWTYEPDDGSLPIVIDANGYQVARVPIRSADGKTTGETDANGRLISAGPDLLAALERLVKVAAADVAPGEHCYDEILAARAAIRKATGGRR